MDPLRVVDLKICMQLFGWYEEQSKSIYIPLRPLQAPTCSVPMIRTRYPNETGQQHTKHVVKSAVCEPTHGA